MAHTPCDQFTILSQHQTRLTRAVQLPCGVKLQAFAATGLQQVELDTDEVHRLLRALPPEWLREALAPNPFLAFDDPLEEAEMRAELRRLNGTDFYA